MSRTTPTPCRRDLERARRTYCNLCMPKLRTNAEGQERGGVSGIEGGEGEVGHGRKGTRRKRGGWERSGEIVEGVVLNAREDYSQYGEGLNNRGVGRD